MNDLYTVVTVAAKHTQAAIVMHYRDRTRVRHVSLHQSADTIQELIKRYEIQFLHDMDVNGRIRLKKSTSKRRR